MRWLWVSLSLVVVACGPKPAPEYEPEAPVQACEAVDAATGVVGEGEAFVQVENPTPRAVTAKLLSEQGEELSLLSVPSHASGAFAVQAGVYQLRFRDEGSCDVSLVEDLKVGGAIAGTTVRVEDGVLPGSPQEGSL